MKARVPLMIQDPEISGLKIDRLVEEWTGLDEDHYLDGPVTPRVAVVDLDPETEETVAGAVYEAPTGSRTLGRYRVDKKAIDSPAFIQASVFGTVMRTVYLFEEADTLGRKVTWGFGAPQLLVVPRAGWWENAYYERSSHSLQFYSFEAGDITVHTSLSRDIVAHETAHAILDGIDPDLYDALDPQSLALHEAIADLVAVLIAFRSPTLPKAVLDKTRGSIRKSTSFSSIGEQFGRALDPSGQIGYLRSLLNDETLDPEADPAGEPEEHKLSQVLTGALYEYMCHLHAQEKDAVAAKRGITRFSASGEALANAASRFKRLILRGLDYLPPGEITFADYARAAIAADQASHPTDDSRDWLRKRLVGRGIVKNAAQLDVETNVEHAAVAAADLEALVESDWVAYTFADRNRELLRIPADAQFEVLDRLVVTKAYYLGKRRATGEPAPTSVKELLFKVRWTQTEPNPPELGDAPTRRVRTGTTLVIDWDRKVIRACLSPLDLPGRRTARDAMLRRLKERGLLQVTTPTPEVEAADAFASGVDAVVIDGILRIRDTGRTLHVTRGLDDE